MADILALGEPLIEMMGQGDGVTWRQGFGGDTSNAAVAAARQGASVGYVSAVGGDPFGTALRGLWDAEGVDHTHVATRERDPTGVYFVEPHPEGRRFFYARRGSAASLYGPGDLPEATIGAAKVLHVSALSQAISGTMRDAVTRAAGIARAAGVRVSYDTNLRLNLWTKAEALAAIEAFLPLADIVLPSDDEAEVIAGTAEVDGMLAHFARHGAGIVALKRGAAGASLLIDGARHDIGPAPAAPIDSTGAGDSFAGAFLAYLLETDDPLEAARRAGRVAAGTVSGYGAVAPIPRRADVLAS